MFPPENFVIRPVCLCTDARRASVTTVPVTHTTATSRTVPAVSVTAKAGGKASNGRSSNISKLFNLALIRFLLVVFAMKFIQMLMNIFSFCCT